MEKHEILEQLKNIKGNNVLLSWSTGVGKTLGAITLIKQKQPQCKRILVVIPKLVLIQNWKNEIMKWSPELIEKFEFSTYVSLPKHENELYDVIVFDEAHHLSERCRNSFKNMRYKLMIALSATIGSEIRDWLVYNKNIETVTIGLRDATSYGLLPDPHVYLIKLTLDNVKRAYKINKYGKEMLCTQRAYYAELCRVIEYFKNINKKVYLSKCNQRLKWLSGLKIDYTKQILKQFCNYRTLTFCGSIEQAQQLGDNAVHSKNPRSKELVDAFNARKIKHLTAVDILTEGVNLSDCRIGIFMHLNGSSRLRIQKNGRILRNTKPIIIIPYYDNTREAEIVENMLQNYNKELIHHITNIKEIKL